MAEHPTMRICGRHCDTGETITVTLADGTIQSVVPGETQTELGGPDVWLAPGFFDLQLNGYGGADFNRGGCHAPAGASGERPQELPVEEVIASLQPIFAAAARAGTALLCPTIVTNSPAAMEANLRALARALEADRSLARRVPAVHVEGPYLSSEEGPRGAHPQEHVRDPDWNEFQRLQEAAGGRIRLLTLAPEREGALPFIEQLAGAGVVPALGHTGAEPETIRDAVQAGAQLSTHLGNGAHALLRRHPNYIWEQLACDALFATIIADGHHLPPAVVKCMARAKGPERLALVSDAISLGGLPAGEYSNGRHAVLPSGKIVLTGTPYLVGAGHLLDHGVANAQRFAGLSLADAVAAATAVPARILGVETRKGRLAPGYDADLTLFRTAAEGPLEIVATVCGGECVYSTHSGQTC
jgi:N-acetylglucosamine-6-phosphate deacetylase